MLACELGIGKTRAADVFAREADANDFPFAGAAVARWATLHRSGPFRSCSRHVRKRPPSNVHPRLASVQSQLLRLLPSCPLRKPPSSPASCRPQRQSRPPSRIFDAVARTLGLASEHGPCVLVLTLDRADPASLELVHSSIDEITPPSPARATCAQDGPAERSARARARPPNATAHPPRLTSPRRPLPWNALLARRARAVPGLFTHSEGTPFFMTELALQLRVNEATRSAPHRRSRRRARVVAHTRGRARCICSRRALVRGRGYLS